MSPAAPRPASTVVLLRPSASRFEVFLVRRHDTVAFMGGAHVFPGGRVDDEDRAETMEARHRLAAVREVREEAGVTIDPGALVPFAHWVTPDIEIKRYDTWFYVTTMPDGQAALHDGIENDDSMWIQPEEALALCERGEINLPPPTWLTLERLAAFGRVEDVLAWARATTIVRLQPVFEERGGIKRLTVPGEPPARFVIDGGRWILEKA
jgi:8-oxo-dGTP pyrophosphatase MutT (NUDIX family)